MTSWKISADGDMYVPSSPDEMKSEKENSGERSSAIWDVPGPRKLHAQRGGHCSAQVRIRDDRKTPIVQ